MSSIRVVLAGVLAGVVTLFIWIGFSFLTGPIYAMSPELWKPVGDLWFFGLILLNILIGLVYALVYTILGKSMKGSVLDKGLLYGCLLWFIGPLPSILFAHLTINIPPEVIVSWIFSYLINTLVAGIIIVFVYEEIKR